MAEEKTRQPSDARHEASPENDPEPADGRRAESSQSADEPQSVDEPQELERLRGELREAAESALRAQADLENFRKRTRRDYEEQLKYAAAPLMRDVLDVLDNLRRALESAADEPAAAGLREGVQMVAEQLEGVLAKHHCRRVPAVGEPFDPNFHEAISQIPSDEFPEGTVAHEALPGFQMHGRVVRPSQVVVSTGAPGGS